MHAHAGEGVPRRPEAGVGVGGLLLGTQLIAFDWISAGLTYSPPLVAMSVIPIPILSPWTPC